MLEKFKVALYTNLILNSVLGVGQSMFSNSLIGNVTTSYEDHFWTTLPELDRAETTLHMMSKIPSKNTCLEPDGSQVPKCPIDSTGSPIFLSHASNCSRFYVCESDYHVCLHECAPMGFNSVGIYETLYFDGRYQYPEGPVCHWPSEVDCSVNTSEIVTTTFPTQTSISTSTTNKQTAITSMPASLSPSTSSAAISTSTNNDCLEPDGWPVPKCPYNQHTDVPTFLSHAWNCSRFFVCEPGWDACMFECPPLGDGGTNSNGEYEALYFDVQQQYPVGPVCDWPWVVDCTMNSTAIFTTTMSTISLSTATTSDLATTVSKGTESTATSKSTELITTTTSQSTSFGTTSKLPTSISTSITSTSSFTTSRGILTEDTVELLVDITCVAMAMFGIGATLCNILVIITFCANKDVRTTRNYSLLSLSVSDLMAGCVSTPIQLTIYKNDIDSDDIMWCAPNLFSSVILYHVFYMACDRFYLLYWPLHYHGSIFIQKGSIVLMMVLIWATSSVWCFLPAFYSMDLVYQYWYSAVTVYLFYTAPLCLTIILYGLFLKRLKMEMKKFRDNMESIFYEERQDLQRQYTEFVVKQTFLLLLLYSPNVIWRMLESPGTESRYTRWYMVSTNTLQILNSLINPIFYFIGVKEFRENVYRTIIRILKVDIESHHVKIDSSK